jgi:hypothetical protein
VRYAIGIDSVKIELGSPPRVFEGLLGIAVTCKEEESFVSLYRECMRKSLEAKGLKTNRTVLKAYDISRLAPEHEDEVIIPFFDCLTKEIERIDIYYTRYNPKKLPSVSIFGRDRPTTKNPVEFVRMITNAYPHYCGYWYLNKYSSKEVSKMYLDHFESCHTPAWDSMSQFKDSVLYLRLLENMTLIRLSSGLARLCMGTLWTGYGYSSFWKCVCARCCVSPALDV